MTPGPAFDFALTHPVWLAVWAVLVLASLAFLGRDLWLENPRTGALMKWVWRLTVLFSGPLGIAVYAYAGRRRVARDTLWRRAVRSAAHGYAGCGTGEVAGIVVTAGILGLGTFWIVALTFLLAYAVSLAFTAGPLLHEGAGWRTALWNSVVSESASITVMEGVALAVDRWISAGSGLGEPRFWWAIVISLTAGFIAAYPANVALVATGVKARLRVLEPPPH